MEFSSVIFIELFLPVLLVLYYLAGLIRKAETKLKVQNALLLAASLLFYAWGGLWQLLLFAALTVANFCLAILIRRAQEADKVGAAKGTAVFTVVFDAALLAFFKYFTIGGSVIARVRAGTGLGRVLLTQTASAESTVIKLVMPLAFSFITFQAIAYIADVYNKKTEPSRNLLEFGLFMSLFAQLTQGPIMRYGDLGPQFRDRTVTLKSFAGGAKRFCYGFGKKVLIANTLGAMADKIWGAEDISALGSGVAWLGILFYTLQIYYDFSGYTDMAIGTGAMFGFKISENFDYPYTSLSIQEFWRRWHISLSSWFRDYIYIPLGGNRRGKGRLFFNLFVVFFVTGIWHGANLNFILWGMLFAVLSIIERAFLGELLKKNPVKPVNWLYATFAVMMGWVLFRAPSLAAAGQYYGQLFAFKASSQGLTVLSYLNMEVLAAAIAGILLCGFVQRPLAKVYEKVRDNTVFICVDTLVWLCILAWSIVQLVSGSYNPSIYGNF